MGNQLQTWFFYTATKFIKFASLFVCWQNCLNTEFKFKYAFWFYVESNHFYSVEEIDIT